MNELSLQVIAQVREGRLVIRYAVRNAGDRDAYLLNRLHRASPPAMTPDIAYVELDMRNQVAEISKRIADIPSTGGSGPTAPVAPFVTPLRTGQSFTEDVHLDLPLRIYREYGRSPRPDPQRDRVVEYRGLRFVLGYYWRDRGVTETPSVAMDQPVIIPGNFPRYPEFHLIASQVVPLRFPVVEPGS